jgi:hypothetical protein
VLLLYPHAAPNMIGLCRIAKFGAAGFVAAPGNAAETFFEMNNCERLRAIYQGKLSEAAVQRNITRLADGVSHWLLDEVPDRVSALIIEHLSRRSLVPSMIVCKDEELGNYRRGTAQFPNIRRSEALHKDPKKLQKHRPHNDHR